MALASVVDPPATKMEVRTMCPNVAPPNLYLQISQHIGLVRTGRYTRALPQLKQNVRRPLHLKYERLMLRSMSCRMTLRIQALRVCPAGAFGSYKPLRARQVEPGMLGIDAERSQHHYAFRLKGPIARMYTPFEARSCHIWSQAAQMLKMIPLKLILAISGARPPRCSK